MNQFSTEGTVLRVLPQISGTSKVGKPWTRRDILIQHQEGKYPKHILLSDFSEDPISLVEGQKVSVTFAISSKETSEGGKFFTNASVISLTELFENEEHKPETIKENTVQPVIVEEPDDLPF